MLLYKTEAMCYNPLDNVRFIKKKFTQIIFFLICIFFLPEQLAWASSFLTDNSEYISSSPVTFCIQFFRKNLGIKISKIRNCYDVKVVFILVFMYCVSHETPSCTNIKTVSIKRGEEFSQIKMVNLNF